MPLKVKLWQGFNYYVLDEQQPTWTKLRNVIEYHEKHGAIFKFSTLLLRFHSLTAKELKEQKKISTIIIAVSYQSIDFEKSESLHKRP